MTSLTRLVPFCLLLATACSPIAVSPALRTVPLETAETARRGHVAVRAGGGGHTYVGTGGAGIGIGVEEDVELQLEGTVAYAESLDASRSVDPFFGTGRVGVKHRVADALAFTGGLGAGVGPWGAFSGGDLGIILAYENPWVIPFFAARMQLSVPIDPITEIASDGNGGTLLLTPSSTLWLQPSTGMRIPFCHDDACDGVRVSMTVAFAWTQMIELDGPGNHGTGLGFEGGLTIEP